jgi:hypothetical protein
MSQIQIEEETLSKLGQRISQLERELADHRIEYNRLEQTFKQTINLLLQSYKIWDAFNSTGLRTQLEKTKPIGNAYVTTTDHCSHCGSKLTNAETARLEYQAEAARLVKVLEVFTQPHRPEWWLSDEPEKIAREALYENKSIHTD